MRTRNQFSISIVIFVLAQLAWFALLGLFIYRFFLSRSLASQISGPGSWSINPRSTSLFILIAGALLYVVVSVAMAVIFKNFSSQLRMTKMYDTFIANITHELKSPLASIRLHLETLSYRDMSKEQARQFVRLMLQDASRLDGLINAILKISALEQKKDVFEVQVHRAESVIRNTIEECRSQFRLKPEQLLVNGSADVKCVLDKNALKVVFDNLIDNALKYTLNPPLIHIQLQTTPQSVVITFRDNGIGLPPKTAKKIFRKFHRIDDPSSPNVKGSGLGLYWVKEIIRYHGGRIEASSKGEGQGTTFIISLPIYEVSKTRYLNSLIKWTNRKKRQQDKLYEQTHQ